MYAVIASGGKQERVEVGSRVNLELTGGAVGEEIGLAPVLLVDGDRVLAAPMDLEGAVVRGRVLGEAKGPKITGFTYKAKARARRRYGHRQRYHTIEITAITPR
jgi:large subunit ribosomal protein L21